MEADPMAAANDPHTWRGTTPGSFEALIAAAQHEPTQGSRSRLAPCAPVISILREKGWSFAAITAWFGQHGVRVAESTVQRFHRSQQRRDAAKAAPSPTITSNRPAPTSRAPHENPARQAPSRTVRPADRPKYNTDF